jgi:hypothetical protein
VVPPGYEPVNSGKEVEIPTPLGQKKAEYTFLLRRKKAAESNDAAEQIDPEVRPQ